MIKENLVFLSIRPAERSSDGYKIRAKRKHIHSENLYYKFSPSLKRKKIISGLSRMTPSDIDSFLFDFRVKHQTQVKKNVLFFIHGYHPVQASLHFNLLRELQKQYSSKYGSIIFFSWPNRGLMGKEDDEARKIGEILAKKYIPIFRGLAEVAVNEGAEFDLMCQSFGHHILNSFVSHHYPLKPFFNNVFSMAADIPKGSIDKAGVGTGAQNNLGRNGDWIYYNLNPLARFAKKTILFHDTYDLVLEASQNNFLKKHRRLGQDGINESFGSFELKKYSTYSESMVMGNSINLSAPNIRIMIQTIIKLGGENKFNRRHQYFHSNPKVVQIVLNT